mgnify:CR=1 FL=1
MARSASTAAGALKIGCLSPKGINPSSHVLDDGPNGLPSPHLNAFALARDSLCRKPLQRPAGIIASRLADMLPALA